MSQNINTKTSNIFSTFPQYTLGRTPNANNGNILSTMSKDEIELTATKKKKTRRRILFGSTIASTILTAGIIGLVFAKGVHGSAYKNKLASYTKKLSQDIHDIGELSAKDIPTRIVYYTKKGIKKLLDLLQASSNITTFKDYGGRKIYDKTKITKSFADKTTKLFKKINDGTLGKQYDLVEVDISRLTSRLKHHDISELRKLDQKQIIKIKDRAMTLGQWLDELEAQTSILGKTFSDNFTEGARLSRDARRMSELSDLPQKIHDRFFKNGRNSLFDIRNYKTYATEDLAKDVQEKYADEILLAQRKITNGLSSVTTKIKQNLTAFADEIKPEDTLVKADIKELRKLIEKFKKCSGKTEIQDRANLSKEISKILEKLNTSISSSQLYDDIEKKKIQSFISNILKDISECESGSSKGALEEIMTILKGLNLAQKGGTTESIVSKDTYKTFEKISKRIAFDLQNATKLEKGEYFLKQAELIVGSAPNDIVSLLFPIGAGAYAIGKGKDKDERISATLTTCVPLVGTFATFIYGTIKMFSGAKNLIFSAISGALLGMAGDYCDSLYKKSKNPNEVKTVVQDGYDKIWTGIESQIHKFDENVEEEKKK